METEITWTTDRSNLNQTAWVVAKKNTVKMLKNKNIPMCNEINPVVLLILNNNQKLKILRRVSHLFIQFF
jgi:hypothetical protein